MDTLAMAFVLLIKFLPQRQFNQYRQQCRGGCRAPTFNGNVVRGQSHYVIG